MMKTVINLALFVSLTCLLNSWGCNKDCPDCYELDEETCECIPDYSCLCTNGILDEGEEEIDCGGICDPCFECFHNYCTLLSGATSDEPKTNKKWYLALIPSNTLDFYSDGTIIWNKNVDTGFGTWELNNANSPTVIIVDIDNVVGSWGQYFMRNEFGIDTMTADILVFSWEGEATWYPVEEWSNHLQDVIISNIRHYNALKAASEGLQLATEGLVSYIFKNFCIGK